MLGKLKRISQFGLNSLNHLQGSFSQFGEDFYLRIEFAHKMNGFYVDVGAYHPFHYSNTKYLRTRGWTGINIEPLPDNFALLEKHCPKDINLNLAVSDREGSVNFHVNDVGSQILENDATEENVIVVPTRRLDSILQEHCKRQIDLLSVDCEGFDLEVLGTNDWDKFRPYLVILEDHSCTLDSESDRFMNRLGYQLVSWYRLSKFYKDMRD
jgi:FkbM family methyltransferase